MKITPHIGYNCHDAIMAEMAHIVEACNGGGGGGGGGQYILGTLYPHLVFIRV